LVEAMGRAYGVEHPVQMTLGFSNGEGLWAVRYSSEHRSRTLFISADAATVKALHPTDARFARFTDEDRVIVSEPLSDLPGLWNEVPESTVLVVQEGADERHDFRPQVPAQPVATAAP
jgi:glutamine amidotransferase